MVIRAYRSSGPNQKPRERLLRELARRDREIQGYLSTFDWHEERLQIEQELAAVRTGEAQR